MQVGIRFHDTIDLPLPERIQCVKDQGFTCVHMALAKVIQENSVRDAAMTPGYAMYLRRLFQKADLDVAVLGCYLNLADPNEKRLRESLKRYQSQIRFASILGAGVVGTETGAPNEAYRYEPVCRSEEALEVLIRNLSKVVEYAEHMGVILAIEPVCRHIVYDAKRARKVLDAIQSPNLQIIFDPVNLLNEENYTQQDRIIGESLELFGEEIAVVHMKDFQITEQGLKSVAAGTGQMKYDELMKFIKHEKPYMHVTLEDTVPDNAVAAREFLESYDHNIG